MKGGLRRRSYTCENQNLAPGERVIEARSPAVVFCSLASMLLAGFGMGYLTARNGGGGHPWKGRRLEAVHAATSVCASTTETVATAIAVPRWWPALLPTDPEVLRRVSGDLETPRRDLPLLLQTDGDESPRIPRSVSGDLETPRRDVELRQGDPADCEVVTD